MKGFARSFPFIVTISPTQRSLIGQIIKFRPMLRSPVKILFGSRKHLLEMRRALALDVEKRMNLKAFCRFWCCWKGFIKSIKGGTSCCIGEAKGGVQA